MPFDDNDLKRLKAPFDDCQWIIDPRKLEELIARLEAAENVCDTVEACFDIWTQQAVKDSLKNWRKTCGRNEKEVPFK